MEFLHFVNENYGKCSDKIMSKMTHYKIATCCNKLSFCKNYTLIKNSINTTNNFELEVQKKV